VWSFGEPLADLESITDKDESDFSYGPCHETDSPSVHEDQIFAGLSVDANLPIMDIRQYALMLFSHHIQRLVVFHWHDVVTSYKSAFAKHVRRELGTLDFWNIH
jgi:hypothetical protein